MARRWMLAIGAALALLTAKPQAARALSCASPGNHVLLPSSTTLASVKGPWLVLRETDATVSLTDEIGQDIPIESARKLQSLGCVFTFELYRPKGELTEGALFTLAVSSPSAPPDSRDFMTSSREPRRLQRTLDVALERVSQPMILDVYGEPLQGEQANGYFFARVTADSPSLMFIELSVADTKFGPIAAGSASIGTSSSSLYSLTTYAQTEVPELTTSSPCARVVVRDALDAPIYDKELCPEAGGKLEETLTVEMPEHLIPEAPEGAEEGCSCSNVRSAPDSRWSFWLVALAALAMGRRFGFRGVPSAACEASRELRARRRAPRQCIRETTIVSQPGTCN